MNKTIKVVLFFIMVLAGSEIALYAGRRPGRVTFPPSDPQSYSPEGRRNIRQKYRKKRVDQNMTQAQQEENIKQMQQEIVDAQEQIDLEQAQMKNLETELASTVPNVEESEVAEQKSFLATKLAQAREKISALKDIIVNNKGKIIAAIAALGALGGGYLAYQAMQNPDVQNPDGGEKESVAKNIENEIKSKSISKEKLTRKIEDLEFQLPKLPSKKQKEATEMLIKASKKRLSMLEQKEKAQQATDETVEQSAADVATEPAVELPLARKPVKPVFWDISAAQQAEYKKRLKRLQENEGYKEQLNPLEDWEIVKTNFDKMPLAQFELDMEKQIKQMENKISNYSPKQQANERWVLERVKDYLQARKLAEQNHKNA